MANIQNNETDTERLDALFERISILIEQSRSFVYSSVNVAEVKTRYEVGRYIFEDEQQGERAAYGKTILKNLSSKLTERYGKDWSYDTLKRCRFFYQAYENTVIGATSLPQLGNKPESVDNKDISNCGNIIATIQRG
ncbi:MAG: DUF1016 N-terminal domain-containing protein [Bacteroidales bacterium]|nr:DUF1016 N-terminal domain-containing protein [Bacteroidales bacterium]